MTQTDSDLHLEVTKVGRDGKRRYCAQAKRRLVEACLQPGVSVSGLALKAGVNANLLRRWIMLHRQHLEETAIRTEKLASVSLPSSSFVQVVEGRRHGIVQMSGSRAELAEPSSVPISDAPAPRALSHLTVQMPNGVTLKLECSGHDTSLVSAMIETLGRCNVPPGR
jgi:transposase